MESLLMLTKELLTWVRIGKNGVFGIDSNNLLKQS